MPWSPPSIIVGGETFVEADFAPWAFPTTWPRFLNALAVHLTNIAALAGVQVATSITTSDNIAYTYDTPSDVADGGLLVWKHPSSNAASGSGLTITRTGGAARSLRNSDGAQITTGGVLRGGRTYLLRREGATFVNTDFDLVRWQFNRDRFVGGSASIDMMDTDAQTVGLVRVLQSAGRLLAYVEGDGSAVGTLALDVRASGVRGPQGAGFVNENGEQYFHPANPPSWHRDMQAHLEMLTDGYWEDPLAVVQVSNAEAYTISGSDRSLDSTVSGTVYRAHGMAIGQEVSLRVRAGGATIVAPQVWAGTNDGLARSNADFGSVTSSAGAATFTFTSGDPLASGLRRGDVVRFANLDEAANNGVDFTILAFGGTSNRTVTVTPPPVTMASADGTWSLTRQGSRQLALPANGYFRIRREQTEFLAEQRTIFSTVATTALPLPAIALAGDGQSWVVRMSRHMLRGWQEARSALGLSRDVEVIEGTAFGASSELRGFDTAAPYLGDGSYVPNVSTDNGNFLWDHFNGEPGPNLIAMRDAINRSHLKPQLRWLVLLHGLNVMQNLSEAGALTPDHIKDSRIAAADWLMAQTGLDLEWLVSCGPPSQEVSEGVFPSSRWWPVRDAYVRLCNQDARFKRGPEFYDLRRNRRGERHHPFQEARRFGRRLALFHAEYLNKLSNRLITGGVAGSPGTVPTNFAAVAPSGTTRTISLGTSAEGRPYLEVRFQGTPTSTATSHISFEGVAQIPGKAGETWTSSAWLTLTAGSTSGLTSMALTMIGTNGTSNIETSNTSIISSIGSSSQRFSTTRTMNNAATTHVRGSVSYGYTSGVPIDFTLRIEAPQIERGGSMSAWCGPQWLGPQIVAFEELTATSFRFQIDYGSGQGITQPRFPVGMALLPAGSSQFAAPLNVARWQWQNGPGTTVYLTAHTATVQTGARPAFPWGPAEGLQSPSNLIAAYSSVIDDWLPLRTLNRALL